jgi:hypothetical protein
MIPMKRIATITLLALLVALESAAYPLDGYSETDIHRLEAYYRAKEILLERGSLQPGSLLPLEDVQLGLADRPGFELPAPDPEFTNEIRAFLGADEGGYGIAVLDISDPDKPRYAEIAGGRAQNPGSVGKIVIGLGWFQAMADLYPAVDDRVRLLKDTQITADSFIYKDSHIVPIWKPGDPSVQKRPLQEGDQANLYTFMDWMLSASSNAGAREVLSELMTFRHYGAEYPVSAEKKAAYFDETPKAQLSNELKEALQGPLKRNGLDPQKLRQGKFFTRAGKGKVDGPSSVSTPRELMRFAMLMEQGKLVDAWSSREFKRLLYLTDKRIRYASHPALATSAVYYKSGSLYSCKAEAGFTCEKYMGNRVNFLNSLAIVETNEGGRRLHYIVALLSNVLRKNSAVEHQTLAMRIHRLIEAAHPPQAIAPLAGDAAVSDAASSGTEGANPSPSDR